MTRALVLGGGGIAGISWEIGVLLGLEKAGIAVLELDLLVGTSAGSVVASQVGNGASLQEQYDAQLEPHPSDDEPPTPIAPMYTAILQVLGGDPAPQELLARLGRASLAADSGSETERLAVLADRLASHEWPSTRLLVTAVEAETGVFRAFSAADGVPLLHAVAASCAVPCVWPPVTVDGTRWVDGGIRSVTNADLAAGHDQVLVIAPMVTPAGSPFGGDLGAEVEALRAAGAEVEVIAGDAVSFGALGNPLAASSRVPAARLGLDDGAAAASRVGALWS